MDPFLLSLIAQGVGGIFLVLVCTTLYAYRRHAAYGLWALAWLCFSVWTISSWRPVLDAPEASRAVLVRQLFHDPTVVCGWWQLVFVVAGVRSLQGAGWRGSVLLLALGAAAGFGFALYWTTSAALATDVAARHRAAWLAAGLAVGHGWAAWQFRAARHGTGPDVGRPPRDITWTGGRPQGWGCRLLALGLSLVALLHGVFFLHATLRLSDEAVTLWAQYSGYSSFLLEVLLAVGIVVLLLDREQQGLQDVVDQLAESEERFRLVFEHGGVGMALLTPHGIIVQVNPAMAAMLGFQPQELRGTRLADRTHHEDRTSEVRTGSTSEQAPALYEREKRYLRQDGSTVWVQVIRMPVRDPAGTLRYLVGVFLDITERRQAREALAASEQRYRLRFEGAFDALHVWSEAEELVDANPAFCRLIGYSLEEARKLPLDSVADDPSALREHFRTVLRRGGDRLQTRLRRKDGGRPEVEMSSALLESEGRRLVHVISRDVTDRRRLEAQLQRVQRMETLSTLVGGIAHDFNNQLTGVLGNLALAAREWENSPAARTPVGYLVEAERAAQRCADMTASLLTFSGRRIGRPQPLDLDAHLLDADRLLRPALPPSIRLQTELGARPWRVNAEGSLLHEALTHLALNGRDAMPDGGTLTLRTRRREFTVADQATDVEVRPGRFVQLSVADTGGGMLPEVRERLFEPFFTTKEFGKGSGLGLALVFGVVKAHGGWIGVESEPGKGTAIHLYLPVMVEPTTGPQPLAEPPPAVGPRCALVVDDEEVIRTLASAVLLRLGFRVLTAADGVEALALFDAHAAEVDLVLLDYTMPGLTGLEVLDLLRRRAPAVRVILSSGYALERNLDQLHAAGALAFVAKPYRPQDLVRVVNEVINRSPRP